MNPDNKNHNDTSMAKALVSRLMSSTSSASLRIENPHHHPHCDRHSMRHIPTTTTFATTPKDAPATLSTGMPRLLQTQLQTPPPHQTPHQLPLPTTTTASSHSQLPLKKRPLRSMLLLEDDDEIATGDDDDSPRCCISQFSPDGRANPQRNDLASETTNDDACINDFCHRSYLPPPLKLRRLVASYWDCRSSSENENHKGFSSYCFTSFLPTKEPTTKQQQQSQTLFQAQAQQQRPNWMEITKRPPASGSFYYDDQYGSDCFNNSSTRWLPTTILPDQEATVPNASTNGSPSIIHNHSPIFATIEGAAGPTTIIIDNNNNNNDSLSYSCSTATTTAVTIATAATQFVTASSGGGGANFISSETDRKIDDDDDDQDEIELAGMEYSSSYCSSQKDAPLSFSHPDNNTSTDHTNSKSALWPSVTPSPNPLQQLQQQHQPAADSPPSGHQQQPPSTTSQSANHRNIAATAEALDPHRHQEQRQLSANGLVQFYPGKGNSTRTKNRNDSSSSGHRIPSKFWHIRPTPIRRRQPQGVSSGVVSATAVESNPFWVPTTQPPELPRHFGVSFSFPQVRSSNGASSQPPPLPRESNKTTSAFHGRPKNFDGNAYRFQVPGRALDQMSHQEYQRLSHPSRLSISPVRTNRKRGGTSSSRCQVHRPEFAVGDSSSGGIRKMHPMTQQQGSTAPKKDWVHPRRTLNHKNYAPPLLQKFRADQRAPAATQESFMSGGGTTLRKPPDVLPSSLTGLQSLATASTIHAETNGSIASVQQQQWPIEYNLNFGDGGESRSAPFPCEDKPVPFPLPSTASLNQPQQRHPPQSVDHFSHSSSQLVAGHSQSCFVANSDHTRSSFNDDPSFHSRSTNNHSLSPLRVFAPVPAGNTVFNRVQAAFAPGRETTAITKKATHNFHYEGAEV